MPSLRLWMGFCGTTSTAAGKGVGFPETITQGRETITIDPSATHHFHVVAACEHEPGSHAGQSRADQFAIRAIS